MALILASVILLMGGLVIWLIGLAWAQRELEKEHREEDTDGSEAPPE